MRIPTRAEARDFLTIDPVHIFWSTVVLAIFVALLVGLVSAVGSRPARPPIDKARQEARLNAAAKLEALISVGTGHNWQDLSPHEKRRLAQLITARLQQGKRASFYVGALDAFYSHPQKRWERIAEVAAAVTIIDDLKQ